MEIKTGEQYIFNTEDEALAKYNGTRVTVIEPLPHRVYKVRFYNGLFCNIFEEELSEIKDIVTTVEITVEKVVRIAREVKVTQEQLDQLMNGENPFYDEILAELDGDVEYDYAVNDLNGKEIVPWSRS